ncbi:MAG: NUDIX domain-containing protein [Paludibacter sp.]|nr:NUDIX domain-containing protein [Paludibacter sp.]
MLKEEFFPLVDERGNVTGKASRTECHSGSFLLHPVVHLHVINSKGELYLQKRSENKDIQPGKWDTSVGGHVDYGEEVETALYREVSEELGITDFNPVFMISYKFRSDLESELVNSFYTIYDGVISPDPIEISEGRFWTVDEIKSFLRKNVFTPNFENEFEMLMSKKMLPL